MKHSWDDCTPFVQAHIIAYDQRREYDDGVHEAEYLKASIPKMPTGKRGRSK